MGQRYGSGVGDNGVMTWPVWEQHGGDTVGQWQGAGMDDVGSAQWGHTGAMAWAQHGWCGVSKVETRWGDDVQHSWCGGSVV